MILGVVVLFKEKPVFKKKWFNILATYLLPVGLIVAGYLIDVTGIACTLKFHLYRLH